MPLPDGTPDYFKVKVDDPGDQNVYVCMRHIRGAPLLLPDNVLGECSSCGHDIERRPIDLATLEDRPVVLLCMACAELRLAPSRGRA